MGSAEIQQEEREPEISLNLPALIPDDYISNDAERLLIYKRLSSLSTKEDILDSCLEFEQRIPEIKVFLSRSHSQTRKAVKDAWGYLVQEFGADMLPIKVPERADVVNHINKGSSIFEGKCSNDVRTAIDELVTLIAPIKDLPDNKVLQ